MEVEVARDQTLYTMAFERGKPKTKLIKAGRAPNRRGTKIRFKPDPQIFGEKAAFDPARVFKMARSKAYLFGGVEMRWHCAKELLRGVENVPEKATFHFADGLKDYLAASLEGATLVHPDIFTGSAGKTGSTARPNGRSPGPPTPTASSLPIATRSRRPTAARTNPACAARYYAASRITPSASAKTSALRPSPATT